MKTSHSPWTVGALSIALAAVLLGLTVSNPASGRQVLLSEPAPASRGVVAAPSAPRGAAADPVPSGATKSAALQRRPPARSGPVSVTGLRVEGNQIVNADGVPVRLLGFNSSGAEYACIEGWGVFDGPASYRTQMPASAVTRMAQWSGANTVRVPLNEQCWLGLGVKPAYGGAAYRAAIRHYVHLLLVRGFAVVLDLHRSAPAKGRSLQQEQMPDRDHSLTFWRQVANAYKHNTSVIFDVFNEPWPYADVSSPRAWRCWRDGGCKLMSRNTKRPYIAAGMNELIAAIRSTGARNILAVGGIHWAETLDQWLQYQPTDPRHNLIASFHNYAYNRYCKDNGCYDTVLARVAASVPLFAGEVGPDTVGTACTPASVKRTGFSRRILSWLDAHQASYTPWSWNAWGDCYSLVTSYRGQPTPIWGRDVKARLAANKP